MVPLISQGMDVIGLSQTGTGKTAAFVLPMLNNLANSKKRARRGACSVLILSPTRELTNQIADTVRRYGKYVNYTQAIIVGGVSYPPQIRALRRGTDIVIATPGRALDHIESGELSLDETTTIILDEADQMLDFGFLPVIKKITERLPQERQSVLLSATMPKAIKSLAEDLMTDPELVEATPESKPVERIQQQIIYVEKQRKNMALLEIISGKDVERAIVFTRTKFGADRVQTFLNNYGILAVALHGNKSQGQRQRALGQFRKGEVTVLVATDIAGRGIDIDDVSHVINVDLPNIPESYVHRIGRTARAGREGVAISFCSRAEKAYLRDIEKLIGMDLPKRQDEPGKVSIKQSDATPVDMDAYFSNKERNEGRGRGKGFSRSGRDDRGRGRPPRGERNRNDRDGRGKPKRFDKPKPIDPNTLLPDDLMGSDRPKKDRPKKDHFKTDRPRFDKKSPRRSKSDQDYGHKSGEDREDYKTDRRRSDSRRADDSKPSYRKSDGGKSGSGKPFSKRSEGQRSEGRRADNKRSEGQRSETKRSDTKRSDTKRSENKRSDFKKSDFKKSDFKKSGAGKPGGRNKSASSNKGAGAKSGSDKAFSAKRDGKGNAKPQSNSRRRFDAPAERGLKRKKR